MIRAQPPVIKHLLDNAIAGYRLHGASQFKHIGGLVFGVFLGTVPGAIGTDNNAFHNSFLV
jgi:hypothetical protein